MKPTTRTAARLGLALFALFLVPGQIPAIGGILHVADDLLGGGNVQIH